MVKQMLEQCDIFITSKQKAEFYRKRAAVKRTRAVAGAVGAATGAVTGAGMGMFLGTYDAEMIGEFGGMTGAALVGGAAAAVAGRTSIYKYEAGNLPGNFRTENSFAYGLNRKKSPMHPPFSLNLFIIQIYYF